MSEARAARSLKLQFLGAPLIERDGVAVAVDTRKAIALAAYLAVSGQAQGRETVAALLWPEYDAERALANLRRTLWSLNKAVGREWLDAEGETLDLVRRPGFWLDVEAFHAYLTECRSHGHAESDVCMACLPPLQAAARLYRDEFLAGFTLRDSPAFDEWQFFQAEALRDELAGTLERLVHGLMGQGEWEQALPSARRRLALDPLQETAHRQLMRLYAWAGRRSAALRQYQECVRSLREELDVPPEEETVELYEAIRSGQLPTPVTPLARAPSALEPVAAAEEEATLPRGEARGRPVVSNLPAQPTRFVGRESELVDLARLLRDPDCRLLTLVGPGGVGKTRLAIEAASRAGQASSTTEDGLFVHGIYYVSLAPLATHDLLVPVVADALGFSFFQRKDEDPQQQLLNYMRGKQLLLLLDNFEHLVQGAGLLADMLAVAPDIKLLVTSRQRLNLRGEWTFEVGGMSFPQDGEVESLEVYSAVQLFLQSARQTNPHFTLEQEEVIHLVRICQLLEGMPLGVEMAAAWVKMLSCREVAQEVERGLDFLTASLQDLPERHRSLRAVFDHSWRLLPAAQQQAFCRLSVFRGEFDREAAGEVAGADLALLSALVDRSLVRRNPTGRYEMHQVLREYAAEKLALDPALDNLTRDRHCHYFAGFLQERERALSGAGQKLALDEIGRELENIRAAWHRAVDQCLVPEMGQAMGSLHRFWEVRSRFQEGAEAFRQAVAALEACPGCQPGGEGECRRVLGLALASQGWFEHRCYRHAVAGELLRRSLSLLRPLGPGRDLAWAGNVALIVWALEDLDEMEAVLEENLRTFTASGELADAAVTLLIYADIARYHRGDLAGCERYLRQSLATSREAGDRWTVAYALFDLGQLAQSLGARREAKQRYQESLEIRREIGDGYGTALCLDYIGYVARELGEYDEARRFHYESLAASTEIGDRLGIAGSLDNLGLVARDEGEYEEARHHLEQGLALRAEVGRPGDLGNSLEHLGDLALLQGDVEEAARQFQACLEAYERTDWLPVVGKAHRGLGEVAVLQADLPGARQHFSAALALTLTEVARDVSLTLEILGGWAHLLAIAGQAERAAEALVLVRDHPASTFQTRERAARFLAELGAVPRARRPGRPLEEIVEELFAEARRPS